MVKNLNSGSKNSADIFFLRDYLFWGVFTHHNCLGRVNTPSLMVGVTFRSAPPPWTFLHTCSVRQRSLCWGNALAPNRRNSLPCRVRISRQRSCAQSKGWFLLCTMYYGYKVKVDFSVQVQLTHTTSSSFTLIHTNFHFGYSINRSMVFTVLKFCI